jgi:hypothetical protein
LGDEGGLYWTFTDINQFEKLIRLHLTRQVQAWKSRLVSGSTTDTEDSTPGKTSSITEDDEDDGILDLMEVFQGRFAELTEITQRITTATEEIGTKMQERTAEMNALARDAKGNANPKEAKRLITKAASDMEQFTARIDAELPLFNDAMHTGMNSLIKAATLSVDLDNDPQDVQDGLEAARTLRNTLTTSRESIAGFQESVVALPRMTTTLNRAKRGAVNALDRLLTELKNGEQLLTESEKVILNLLDDTNGT